MNWNKKYYSKNVEWRLQHPEKVKKYRQDYYQRHKKEILLKRKEHYPKELQWRREHPDKIKQYNKKQRERQREAKRFKVLE